MALFESSHVDLSVINKTNWYQRFEVLPNIITNGFSASKAILDPAKTVEMISLTCDMDILSNKNLRILELATWDGPIAYYLKNHGLDVYASDIQNPDLTGFNALAKISGLKIPYTQVDIYNLHKSFPSGYFDLIIYMGVFYHLKSPILGFDNIAYILKENGKVYVTGTGIGKRIENLHGKLIPTDISDKAYNLLNELDELGVPITLDYPGTFFNASNWMFPNKSALKSWMIAAGFEVSNLTSKIRGDNSNTASFRCCGTLNSRPKPDHPLVGGGNYQSF